jgi:phospholipase C
VRGRSLSRRRFLGLAAGGVAGLSARDWSLVRPGARPDVRPDLSRPAGTPDPRIPIEHVVVVMMENHSFDNYLGMLSRRGRPAADGFTFDAAGRPADANPVPGGRIRAFRMPSECQMEDEPSQAWAATHQSIAGGAMSGFVAASGDVAMGYWDEADLPFYYSLARTFPLANRWFASCPAQTYPNRRFLMAASAFGLVTDPVPRADAPPPPTGTIFDRLDQYGISWRNYFTDLPQSALFPYVVKGNPGKVVPISQFYADAAAGTLPAFSLVDPEFGATDVVSGFVPGLPVPQVVRAQGQSEENPQNVQFGESFVAGVVSAVFQSPAWRRTALVWLYDEHGGYYDHVPPPAAVAPDGIAPRLGPHDPPGGYDIYGVRVPAVIVSPWARAGYVSPVVHDHTSILKLVETKWNLPSMTRRDALADDLSDFFDFSKMSFPEPPALAAPANPVLSDPSCTTADPRAPVEPVGSGPAPAAGGGGLPPTGPPVDPGLGVGMAGLAALTGALAHRARADDPKR